MSQEQEQATLNYWQLSMLFHQGIGSSITTSQAIHLAGDHAFKVGPHRRVRYKLLNLQHRIIKGRPRKKVGVNSPSASPAISLLVFKA